MLVRRVMITLFLAWTVSVIVGCNKGGDRTRLLSSGPPTRNPYHYTATVTAPGGGCVQNMSLNGAPLGPNNWPQLSRDNKDDITWVLGGMATDIVAFPTNEGSAALPGTPFNQLGAWASTIKEGTNSGAAYLTAAEDDDFYFQYARVVYQGSPCAFPPGGMGIHVTK